MSRKQEGRFLILGEKYPIYDGMNIIGRDLEATVTIRNLKFSKRHAVISIIDGQHYITDYNSINGTRLRGKKLQPFMFYKLNHKAIITMGDVVGTYYIESKIQHHTSKISPTKSTTTKNDSSEENILCNETFNDSNLNKSLNVTIDETQQMNDDSFDMISTQGDNDCEIIRTKQKNEDDFFVAATQEIESTQKLDDDCFLIPKVPEKRRNKDKSDFIQDEANRNEIDNCFEVATQKLTQEIDLNTQKENNPDDCIVAATINENNDIVSSYFSEPTQKLQYVRNEVVDNKDDNYFSQQLESNTETNSAHITKNLDDITKDVNDDFFIAQTQEIDHENANDSMNNQDDEFFILPTQQMIRNSMNDSCFDAETQKLNEINDKKSNIQHINDSAFDCPTQKLVDKNKEMSSDLNDSVFECETQKFKLNDDERDQQSIPNSNSSKEIDESLNDEEEFDFLAPSDVSGQNEDISLDDFDFVAPTQPLSLKSVQKIQECEQIKNNKNSMANLDEDEDDFTSPTQPLSSKTLQKIQEHSNIKQNEEVDKQIKDEEDDFISPTQPLSSKTLQKIQIIEETRQYDVQTKQNVHETVENEVNEDDNTQCDEEEAEIDLLAPQNVIDDITHSEKINLTNFFDMLNRNKNTSTSKENLVKTNCAKNEHNLTKEEEENLEKLGCFSQKSDKTDFNDTEITGIEDLTVADFENDDDNDDTSFTKTKNEEKLNENEEKTCENKDETNKHDNKLFHDNQVVASNDKTDENLNKPNETICELSNDDISENIDITPKADDKTDKNEDKIMTIIDTMSENNNETTKNDIKILKIDNKTSENKSKLKIKAKHDSSYDIVSSSDNESDDDEYLKRNKQLMTPDDSSQIIIRKKHPQVIFETQDYDSDIEIRKKPCRTIPETQETLKVSESSKFSFTESENIILPSQLEESMRLYMSPEMVKSQKGLSEEMANENEKMKSAENVLKPKATESETDTQFELNIPTQNIYVSPVTNRPENPLIHTLAEIVSESPTKHDKTSTKNDELLQKDDNINNDSKLKFKKNIFEMGNLELKKQLENFVETQILTSSDSETEIESNGEDLDESFCNQATQVVTSPKKKSSPKKKKEKKRNTLASFLTKPCGSGIKLFDAKSERSEIKIDLTLDDSTKIKENGNKRELRSKQKFENETNSESSGNEKTELINYDKTPENDTKPFSNDKTINKDKPSVIQDKHNRKMSNSQFLQTENEHKSKNESLTIENQKSKSRKAKKYSSNQTEVSNSESTDSETNKKPETLRKRSRRMSNASDTASLLDDFARNTRSHDKKITDSNFETTKLVEPVRRSRRTTNSSEVQNKNWEVQRKQLESFPTEGECTIKLTRLRFKKDSPANNTETSNSEASEAKTCEKIETIRTCGSKNPQNTADDLKATELCKKIETVPKRSRRHTQETEENDSKKHETKISDSEASNTGSSDSEISKKSETIKKNQRKQTNIKETNEKLEETETNMLQNYSDSNSCETGMSKQLQTIQKRGRRRSNTQETEENVTKRKRSETDETDSIPKRTTRNKKELTTIIEERSQTPTNKRTKLDETLSSRSPSARNVNRLRHKIVFTMLDDANLEATVGRLRGIVVNSSSECTVLVTNKICRSLKFLTAVALGKPIVSSKWITESGHAHQFLDPWDFILKDEENEKRYDFILKNAITNGSDGKLLESLTFLLLTSKNVDVLKSIIDVNGGKCLTRVPTKMSNDIVIVAYEEDSGKYKKYLKTHPYVKIVAAEALFAGSLRQKLDLNSHLLT